MYKYTINHIHEYGKTVSYFWSKLKIEHLPSDKHLCSMLGIHYFPENGHQVLIEGLKYNKVPFLRKKKDGSFECD